MAGRAWRAVNVRQLSLPAVLRILGPPGFAPKQYVMSPVWASASERWQWTPELDLRGLQ